MTMKDFVDEHVKKIDQWYIDSLIYGQAYMKLDSLGNITNVDPKQFEKEMIEIIMLMHKGEE